MKNLPTILCYSHTDMSDVWSSFFGRLKKYMPESRITLLVNKDHEKIPHGVKKIFYDDNFLYTERIKNCIPLIDEEVVLFIHEDMILYDIPLFDDLEKYTFYVKNGVFDSVKLIHAGDDAQTSGIDENLYYGQFSKFSIQPTIIRLDKLKEIFQMSPEYNIWDFEYSVKDSEKHVMCRKASNIKRGLFHYDSIVFPYIATAISKGKWNIGEYHNELIVIFKEYNIDPTMRGCC